MNWNLLGHEWAVSLLQNHIAQGRMRHAYLFTGAQGVGRRTLALKLAQALNCPNPPGAGEACGTCSTCRNIEQMKHPDLSVVQAEQEGGVLKVDQVRELQHSLSLSPYEARYRVALLLRFEEAHPSTANALLKTLEEPPPQVILLLTASNAEVLLPTIVSRCELIRLRPLPFEVVSQGLQAQWGVQAEQAELLARISEGRPGYALRLHQQPELLERRGLWLDDLWSLLGGSRLVRFDYANRMKDDKEALRALLQTWSSFWRDVMLGVIGSSIPLINLDRSEQVGVLASRLSLEAANKVLLSVERTIELLDRNINTRLAMEVLLIDLPRL